jgi:hypothetical protein
MRLYQIPCPVNRNDGKSYAPGTHQAFLRDVAAIAGGYTLLAEAKGVWRDPKDGTVYTEAMRPLQVACDPEALERIKAAFVLAFPDQKCLMVTDMGATTFTDLEA